MLVGHVVQEMEYDKDECPSETRGAKLASVIGGRGLAFA
jgi:hypothetical protein